MAAVPEHDHPFRRDMPDVALPGLEPFHLGGIHIEAQYREAFAGKQLDERKTDVTEADHPNPGGACVDGPPESGGQRPVQDERSRPSSIGGERGNKG